MDHLFLTTGAAIGILALVWLLCWVWQRLKCRGAMQMVNTIPLELCRRILGKDCGLTDNELTLLRDQLYGLGVCRTWLKAEVRTYCQRSG